MKTYVTAIALALASLSSFATQATNVDTSHSGAMSRAEVRVELLTSLAQGDHLPQYGNLDRDSGTPVNSGLTRAAVQAELISSIARGERVSNGNFDRDTNKPTASTLTRTVARADLYRSLARGEYPSSGESSFE